MEQIFKNKVIMITGSSYGIGKSTAIHFAKKGAKVVLSDWKDDIDTLETITSIGGKAIFVKADVSNEEDVKNVISEGIKHFGQLDYAFNNAGIEGAQAVIHESSSENWEKVIGVNLTGVYYCMKHQIPQMLKVGGGAIVNNSSIAGLVGFNGIPAYVASKHAIVGLTKNVALDYAKQNIRVNAVCPGVIQTPMIDRFTGGSTEVRDQLVAAKPMGRVGTPDEIAGVVAFLCSDEASFITGQALAADGGWVAQ